MDRRKGVWFDKIYSESPPLQPLLVIVLALSTAVSAQSQKVEGLIKGRDGDTMILQTSDFPTLESPELELAITLRKTQCVPWHWAGRTGYTSAVHRRDRRLLRFCRSWKAAAG
jgi:hypothetical protein